MTSRLIPAVGAMLLTVTVAVSAQEISPDAQRPWRIVGSFPESEPGPLERRAKRITPENPLPRRTFFVEPEYPVEAAAVNARASVTVRGTIDELGRVGEVRTVGAPVLGAVSPDAAVDEQEFSAALDALVRAASDSIRQWLYDPPTDGPVAFDAVMTFGPDADPEIAVHEALLRRAQDFVMPVVQMAPSPGLAPVDFSAPSWAEGIPRVSDVIRVPTKVRHVSPVYPVAAQDAGVSGVVILETRIEADGRILNARVIRSIPLLDDAALDAVKQWEFTPTRVNGVQTPVLMTVTMQFSMP